MPLQPARHAGITISIIGATASLPLPVSRLRHCDLHKVCIVSVRPHSKKFSTAAARTQRASTSSLHPSSSAAPPWRPAAILDEWVKKEARPISLKQLTFFGRTLTKDRLLSSANYIRVELPTRLAHRLRDMQTLPYVVVSNPNIAHVYERYYTAFETFRRVPEIKTIEDNDAFCQTILRMLQEHLTVIPSMAMGVLECQSYMSPEASDRFMNNMLKARISRRVITEQHIALTNTLKEQSSKPKDRASRERSDGGFVGEVFLKCNAAEVVKKCSNIISGIAKGAFGEGARIPEVKLIGDLGATFPYILSHLEYIIGEILRNSFAATFERHGSSGGPLPPVEVTIVEAPQHVIFRFADQGGGIPSEILPTLWSFGKGPRSGSRLQNLSQVPRMAATIQELEGSSHAAVESRPGESQQFLDGPPTMLDNSLSSLAVRRPGLRLGMGLPMSRVYAEYWAGSLNLQNLTGYGTDVFLQISKLGNKNEQLTTRASMDAL